MTFRDLTQARAIYASLRNAPPPTGPIATIRTAAIDGLSGRRDIARPPLRRLAETRDSALAAYRVPALLTLARLAPKNRQDAAVNAAIAAARAAPSAEPRLLRMPPYDLGDASGPYGHLARKPGSSLRSSQPDAAGEWIDVAFRVLPDGTVGDPEVLRGRGDDWWHPIVLKSLAGRIYAPLEAAPPDGVYRIERFSLAKWMTPGHLLRPRELYSRVIRPEGSLRIERVDVTR